MYINVRRIGGSMSVKKVLQTITTTLHRYGKRVFTRQELVRFVEKPSDKAGNSSDCRSSAC